jgi:hypothetical protein
LNVFQVPVVEIGEVEIGVDHGEAESLMAEEVINLLIRLARFFRSSIQTFLHSYFQVFEGFAVKVALEL